MFHLVLKNTLIARFWHWLLKKPYHTMGRLMGAYAGVPVLTIFIPDTLDAVVITVNLRALLGAVWQLFRGGRL